MNNLETSVNLTNELSDGLPVINPTYYYNAINDGIKRYINEFNYDQNKLHPNNLLAIFRMIYLDLFKPDKPQIYNRKCNIPYSTKNFQILIEIYITLCNVYGCIASVYGLCALLGVENEILEKYVTNLSSQITNYRKEFIRNNLSVTPIGNTVLANNDTSVGLLYTRQNAIENQAIRQGLSLSDLKKIDQNA